jgi:5-formyltetrahydrofolate cyclo-ligase
VGASLIEQKTALRERLQAVRSDHEDLAAATGAGCRRLALLPELAAARVVAGYAAMPGEVSIDAALERLLAAGVTVCLPWVDGPALGMSAVEDLDDLAAGWRGVREPVPGRRVPLRPSAIDVVLVPGVGFDGAGHRLGFGGGHFDRFLARLRRGALAVGIALDEQVVDEVPVEEHDRNVDVLVTPSRTLRPAADPR